MSDTQRGRRPDELPEPGEPAEPDRGGPMGTITGVDAGALGIGDTQRADAPQADVAPSGPTPPAAFDPEALHEAKPWFTTLAAQSGQAGVGNEQPEPVDPNVPPEQVNIEESEERD